jgi:formate hydrogenlyase transcriptional activator
MQMGDSSDEVQILQTCINDLVGLLALPALWRGKDALQVVGLLLDVLLRTLRVDFVYARLGSTNGGSWTEAVRIAPHQRRLRQPRELERALEPCLALDVATPGCVMPNPLGDGEVSVTRSSLGLDKDHGMVLIGSQRDDFPTDIEKLLTRVAINQAVIELQRAQVATAQQRAAEMERTTHQLIAHNTYLREEIDSERSGGEIVGHSPALQRTMKLVEQVAPTNATVLIQGETGTGKELIARAIHRLSGRNEHAFVKLNCAAIPTSMIESELFGHEQGAGAVGHKVGRFELAHRGTIYLDDVGEIPLELQAKLLRVLQVVDVRLIAASNRDLERMVADGEFRSDLYDRLKMFRVVAPPLRERTEDIPPLVQCFTDRYAVQCNKEITRIESETMAALSRYPWPGNVRELANFIERSVILTSGTTLEVPLAELKQPGPMATNGIDETTLRGIERNHILRVLGECNWVISGPSGAATKLGLKRTSLQYKMQRLGIVRPR